LARSTQVNLNRLAVVEVKAKI